MKKYYAKTGVKLPFRYPLKTKLTQAFDSLTFITSSSVTGCGTK